MVDIELDVDFRNGEGVSLMQTAIEVGHEVIINKLKPLVSEESYHPPKKAIELEIAPPQIENIQINEQKVQVQPKSIKSKHQDEEKSQENLILSNKNLNAEDMNNLSSSFSSHSNNLTLVDLSNNQQIGYKGVKYLVNGASGMKALTSGAHEMSIIYQGILTRSNFSMIKLDLSNCNIGDLGSETIGNALYNGQLKCLQLLDI